VLVDWVVGGRLVLLDDRLLVGWLEWLVGWLEWLVGWLDWLVGWLADW
jgi:hypothetical protein